MLLSLESSWLDADESISGRPTALEANCTGQSIGLCYQQEGQVLASYVNGLKAALPLLTSTPGFGALQLKVLLINTRMSTCYGTDGLLTAIARVKGHSGAQSPKHIHETWLSRSIGAAVKLLGGYRP